MQNVKEPTRIRLQHRQVRELRDSADLAEVLVPGIGNQQHAAACVLYEIKMCQLHSA
jgi:hypothetical protein